MVAIIQNGMVHAPIPGESLTKPVGAAPHEKPPKFARPEEACEFIWERLMQRPNFVQILSVLEAGAPASAVTKSILISGFQAGLWTLDVGMIIHNVVLTMICAIGAKAGIKVRVTTKTGQPGMDAVRKMIDNKAGIKEANKTPDIKETPKEVSELMNEVKNTKEGLMSPIKDSNEGMTNG